MKKRWLLFFAFAMEAFGASENLAPRETIARAEKVILYSIRPSTHTKITDDHGNPAGEDAKSERIHDHVVLGKVIASDRSDRESIRAAVLLILTEKKKAESSHAAVPNERDEVSDFEAPALCFEPRHAVCFRAGSNHVDVLICFECGNAELRWHEVRSGDGEIAFKEAMVGIGDDGRETLNRLLDDRKIERDLPPKEKTAQPGATANGPKRPWLISNVRQSHRDEFIQHVFEKVGGLRSRSWIRDSYFHDRAFWPGSPTSTCRSELLLLSIVASAVGLVYVAIGIPFIWEMVSHRSQPELSLTVGSVVGGGLMLLFPLATVVGLRRQKEVGRRGLGLWADRLAIASLVCFCVSLSVLSVLMLFPPERKPEGVRLIEEKPAPNQSLQPTAPSGRG